MLEDVYRLNAEQENDLWENAVFVFDTSALLNLYEYSDNTIADIFTTIFEDLKNRIWIPFNVSLEYIANRHKPIDRLKREYEDLENNFKNIETNISQVRNKTKSKEKHPFFDDICLDEFKRTFDNLKLRVAGEVERHKKSLSNKLDNDVIFNFINSNFMIGDKYSYAKISEIVAEGEFRYRNLIPPGFKDENMKQGFQKYADLIVWKQILDYANNNNKSIVFVMDDLKEDWWLLDKKRKPLSPRNELLLEFDSTFDRKFWMYQTHEFIQKSIAIIKSEIKVKSMNDILEIAERKFVSSKDSHGIELSANREDDEPWRIKRLSDVASFYSKIISEINISKLYDHKGSLTVYWHRPPSDFEKKIIQLAWENEDELGGENVRHVIMT